MEQKNVVLLISLCQNISYFLLCFFAFPIIAAANSVLPYISPAGVAVSWIAFMFFFGFIPIVIVEAVVIWKFIKPDRLSKALKAAFVANLGSYVMGWILVPLVGYFMNGIGDIKNYGDGSDSIVLILTLLILAINFLISVGIEYLLVKQFFKNADKKNILKATWRANIVSYLLLTIFTLAGYFSLTLIN